MHDLTGFQRDLLRVIGGKGEPIGLDVKEAVESYYESEINHGRLYPNLDTLVNKGLIRKQEKDGRTNTYKLTRRGKQEIRARDAWNSEHAPEGTVKNLKRPA